MNDNNINLLVLRSFFDLNSVWLTELDFLKEDYRLIASKINHYIHIKNEFPSKAIIKANVPKFVSGEGTEVEATRKRLRAIMTAIIENDEKPEYTKSELYDLLVEDFKTTKAMEITQKLDKAVLDKDFNKVQKLTDELQRTTKESSNIILRDSVDALVHIKSTDNKVSTGLDFGLETGAELIPKGSLINLLAGTGFGKSFLALQSMLTNFLEHDRNVVNFNYELDRTDIALRIKAFISRVNMQEIETGNFSVSTNRHRVNAVKYVLTRKIDIETATQIIISGDLSKFEKYPLRTNKLIIISAEGDSEYEVGYSGDFEEDELPNDQQLLEYVEKHGAELDDVYVDLITEITFKSPTHSESNDIKIFVKKIKALAKKFSFRVWILNQVADETSGYGLTTNKYSRSLAQTADLVLVIVSLDEMVENEESLIIVKKCRHGQPNQALVCKRELGISRFTPTGDIITLSEVIKKLNKQFSKK